MENYATLNTGAQMPLVGLGTWKAAPTIVGAAVEEALLHCSYRHVDCAMVYGNEAEIGKALQRVWAGGVNREEVFITSKLWNAGHEPRQVQAACEQTLRDLNIPYLDLYLMHWGIAERLAEGAESRGNWRGQGLDKNGRVLTAPVSIRETWEAMESLVRSGLVKAIGVANFTTMMLVDLLSYARVSPAVNQIELHPYLQQTRLVNFCQQQGIVVTAYSPLGTPGNAKATEPQLLQDKTVAAIAEQHGKTPAQVVLRWAVERGTVVIPKSTRPERLRENIEIFDFALTSANKKALTELERHYRFVEPFDWWGIPYFD